MKLGGLSKAPIRVIGGIVGVAALALIATIAGRSKVHEEAVRIAGAHPVVVEALGAPVEQSGLVGKSWRKPAQLRLESYERDLTISGPKGKGTLRMKLEESLTGRRSRRGFLHFGSEHDERLIGLRFQAEGTEYWQDLFSDERPPWAQEGGAPGARPPSDKTAPPPPPPGGWVPLKPSTDAAPPKGPPVKQVEPVKLKEW